MTGRPKCPVLRESYATREPLDPIILIIIYVHMVPELHSVCNASLFFTILHLRIVAGQAETATTTRGDKPHVVSLSILSQLHYAGAIITINYYHYSHLVLDVFLMHRTSSS